MFEQIKDWWESISQREQQLTFISAVILFIAFIYFIVWQPLANNLAASEQQLKNAQQSLEWVKVNANKVISAGGVNQDTGKRQTLSQLINSSAKRNQINITRIQSRNDTVDVWINQIEFNQFIDWITSLQNQHKVKINSADLSQDKVQGLVKINRLTLSY
ncbi:type II secretion system protein M [Psychromonas sp. B3M02]|uniref:type II secretion system protein GspM n=1 Tax=unclassified Psychromonas TaxID=2614957 RepID=UPI000DEB970D|nr:type II secretion system protein M [Psychromonas sp. B3M02]RBW41654.1 type II secretion system protein M [Psychromonas sp. B3M02]